MSERPLTGWNAIQNPEYQNKFNDVREDFVDLVNKVRDGYGEPVGIPGYSPEQEQMLALSLAVVTNPNLLRISHCAHRAVSACMVQQFDGGITEGKILDTLDTVKLIGRLGAFIVDGETAFLVTHGTNNWFDSEHYLPKEQTLNCKLMVGSPTEVDKSNLIYLSNQQDIADYQDVDQACPKRQQQVECHIEHAESSVIKFANTLVQVHDLPQPSRTFLASTWVPCSKCIRMTANHKEAFGNQLDIFSVYGAYNDPDDDKSVNEIIGYLQSNTLGTLSGPYIGITKDPGYGWYPARHDLVAAGYLAHKISRSRGLNNKKTILFEKAMDLNFG